MTTYPLILSTFLTIFEKVDLFFTMLRRQQQKKLALYYLQSMIEDEEEIMTISYILHKVFEIYSKAMEERYQYILHHFKDYFIENST